MVEQFETLLKINTVLSVVPLFVLAGITRIFVRQRQLGEELTQCKKEIAVLQSQRKDDIIKIERLQDFQNHMSERRD